MLSHIWFKFIDIGSMSSHVYWLAGRPLYWGWFADDRTLNFCSSVLSIDILQSDEHSAEYNWKNKIVPYSRDRGDGYKDTWGKKRRKKLNAEERKTKVRNCRRGWKNGSDLVSLKVIYRGEGEESEWASLSAPLVIPLAKTSLIFNGQLQGKGEHIPCVHPTHTCTSLWCTQRMTHIKDRGPETGRCL